MVTLPPVQTARRHLRWFRCVALSALLGLALLPTLSRALAAGEAVGPWAEFCSVAGPQGPGSATEAPAPGPERSAPAPAHCPLCNLHQPLVALPPAGPAGVPTLAATTVPSAPPAADATRPSRAWSSAQPRGPPGRA